MSVLVVAEHHRGRVLDITYELVEAARALDEAVEVAVISADPKAIGLACDGIRTRIDVTVPNDEFLDDVYRQSLEALIDCRSPSVVLLGSTASGLTYGPAVAAKHGLGCASDVFALAREDGGLVATRAYYGGKVHAEVGFAAGKPTMLLLRPGTWPQASGVCTPDVVELVPELTAARTRHVEFREPEAADLDISGVDFLLSIGRGVGERGNVSTFEELADKLGATLVSSRPLVDLGWMPSSRQVGQSGKTVKPKVYLAFGISGAAHHVMGMRDSGTIIAVNSDPDATIFSIADYGVVADLFDVADELERLA